MPNQSSYLILGAGVFGTSTAYYLKRAHPSATVTLVDRDAYDAPTRVAASWDWNKVVRADYRDRVYCHLALEAQKLWRDDQLWKPFYHESGVFWISPTDFADEVIENFKKEGVDPSFLASYDVETAKGLYQGLFKDGLYDGVKKVLVNKSSGWAAAKEALQAGIEECIKLGVDVVQAEIESLIFLEDHGSRVAAGFRSTEGRDFRAHTVVLCTGSYTSKFLVKSAPDWKDLHAGDRIISAGVTEGVAPVQPSDWQRLREMPVAIQEISFKEGADYGCLPLTHMHALKYWGQIHFTNYDKSHLSAPPSEPDYGQWDVPEILKEDVRGGRQAIFGRTVQGVEVDTFRICWEALTPSQDFIISPHSACENLYIATCGSFHGWKFLPVIGKYVVQMLDGDLSDALRTKWAWDRELPSPDTNPVWPRRDLDDLKSAPRSQSIL